MADAAILEVEGLDAAYGQAQILFDVSLTLRARRDRRADGPQRRRQVDHAQGHHGAGAARAPARCASPVATSPGSPSYRIARLGLGYVPEERRIFTDLTVDENLEVGAKAAAAAASRAGVDARAAVRDLPQPRARCAAGAPARCRAASSRCSPSPAP